MTPERNRRLLDFLSAAGTVQGRDHALIGKNNQDSYHIIKDGDIIVGIVTDGCGDPLSPYSEVGAIIGARLIAEIVYAYSYKYIDIQDNFMSNSFWHKMRDTCIVAIEGVIDAVHYNRDMPKTPIVRDLFLFTIVGFIITPKITVIFTLGDGTIYLNGEKVFVDKYDGNAPPYIAYNLVPNIDFPYDSLGFTIRSVVNTYEVQSILIGSDGCEDIPNIDEFWTEDSYFEHKDAIKNRLHVLNKDKQKIDWNNYNVEKTNGKLHDDTTLIVVRRNNDELF